MSNIFKLNWEDIGGAIISAIIVAVLGYVSQLTNLSAISGSELLNIIVLTAVASLAKSLGTDNGGNFLGGIKIK